MKRHFKRPKHPKLWDVWNVPKFGTFQTSFRSLGRFATMWNVFSFMRDLRSNLFDHLCKYNIFAKATLHRRIAAYKSAPVVGCALRSSSGNLALFLTHASSDLGKAKKNTALLSGADFWVRACVKTRTFYVTPPCEFPLSVRATLERELQMSTHKFTPLSRGYTQFVLCT